MKNIEEYCKQLVKRRDELREKMLELRDYDPKVGMKDPLSPEEAQELENILIELKHKCGKSLGKQRV